MLDNLSKYNIVLASNSPRRRELLAGLGIDFEVKVLQDIDESYPSTLPAMETAEYIGGTCHCSPMNCGIVWSISVRVIWVVG